MASLIWGEPAILVQEHARVAPDGLLTPCDSFLQGVQLQQAVLMLLLAKIGFISRQVSSQFTHVIPGFECLFLDQDPLLLLFVHFKVEFLRQLLGFLRVPVAVPELVLQLVDQLARVLHCALHFCRDRNLFQLSARRYRALATRHYILLELLRLLFQGRLTEKSFIDQASGTLDLRQLRMRR